MDYGKDYFGFVYLWFDTVRSKFLIGSHHGPVDDGYTTSTGGKQVQNVFRKRPGTMKRRILEYNTVDDYKETQKLEQKWLDLRPEIATNPKYYNQKQWAVGGIDKTVPRTKSEAWIEKHKARQKELVDTGRHNFNSDNTREWALKRVHTGQHHFIHSNFNKKGFELYANGMFIYAFESKVEACRLGLKAHLVDKLRKFGTYKIQKWSKSQNKLFCFEKNTILRIVEL